jgi:hypothetical protein
MVAHSTKGDERTCNTLGLGWGYERSVTCYYPSSHNCHEMQQAPSTSINDWPQEPTTTFEE